MNSRRRLPLYLALAAAAALSIVVLISRPPPAPELPAAEPFLDPDLQTLFHQVETLVMAGKFDALEAQAAGYRDVDVRLPGGYSKLKYFYRALASFHKRPCKCTRLFASTIAFADKEAAVEAWAAARPGSLTAAVAMAALWTGHAWDTRGHEFADKVPAHDMQLYQAHTRQALTYLKTFDPRRDAEIFSVLMSAVDTAGGGATDLNTLFGLATEAYPTYYAYYQAEANFLQPKWFGAPGELGQFLNRLAADGSDRALIAYSFAAEDLSSNNVSSDLFTKFGVDWPTLKRAFAVRTRYYGPDSRLRNVEMLAATGAADRAFLREMAKAIGDKWDPSVWSSWEGFAAWRAWALAAG